MEKVRLLVNSKFMKFLNYGIMSKRQFGYWIISTIECLSLLALRSIGSAQYMLKLPNFLEAIAGCRTAWKHQYEIAATTVTIDADESLDDGMSLNDIQLLSAREATWSSKSSACSPCIALLLALSLSWPGLESEVQSDTLKQSLQEVVDSVSHCLDCLSRFPSSYGIRGQPNREKAKSDDTEPSTDEVEATSSHPSSGAEDSVPQEQNDVIGRSNNATKGPEFLSQSEEALLRKSTRVRIIDLLSKIFTDLQYSIKILTNPLSGLQLPRIGFPAFLAKEKPALVAWCSSLLALLSSMKDAAAAIANHEETKRSLKTLKAALAGEVSSKVD